MSSVLRPVRKRKKVRKLGRVDILRREDYAELELDPKVECQGRTKTRPEWRRKIRPSGRPVACLKVAVRVG